MRHGLNRLLRRLGYEIVKFPAVGEAGSKGHFLHHIKAQPEGGSLAVCLDVGANAGFFAEEFLTEFPKSQIHCFEPSPDVVAVLREKAAKDVRITVVPAALGDVPGKIQFHLNAKSVTNSILAAGAESGRWAPASYLSEQGSTEVEVRTLDGYCADAQITRVDLLKVDAQGYDLKVLQGAGDLLKERRVGWIYVEMMLVPIYDGQCFFHEIHQHLEARGYQLRRLFGTAYSPQGRMKWTNGLFAPAG